MLLRGASGKITKKGFADVCTLIFTLPAPGSGLAGNCRVASVAEDRNRTGHRPLRADKPRLATILLPSFLNSRC